MRVTLLFLSGLLTLAALPVHAALGRDVASVLHDHRQLQATDTVIPLIHYDVHEARRADGLVVRQYVDRTSGNVFALSWQGPHAPDVGALLGSQAERYFAAAREHRGNHHRLTINAPDLALTIVRLPRGWQGRALLPLAIPAGVDRAEIR
jgi:hypothetical protein